MDPKPPKIARGGPGTGGKVTMPECLQHSGAIQNVPEVPLRFADRIGVRFRCHGMSLKVRSLAYLCHNLLRCTFSVVDAQDDSLELAINFSCIQSQICSSESTASF